MHHLVYDGIWKFKFEVIIAKFPLSFELQCTVSARWQLKVQHGWWLSADYVCKIKNAFVKCITLLNFNFNFNTKPWSHNNFAFAISVAVAEIEKLHFACWRCICLIYYKVHIRSSSFSQRLLLLILFFFVVCFITGCLTCCECIQCVHELGENKSEMKLQQKSHTELNWTIKTGFVFFSYFCSFWWSSQKKRKGKPFIFPRMFWNAISIRQLVFIYTICYQGKKIIFKYTHIAI